MTDERDDKVLEEYLAGGSTLSRRYREASDEEPPASLDRAVLREARAALRPREARRPALFGNWLAPAALAATVLLSVSLVLRVVTEAPTEAPEAVRVAPREIVPAELAPAPAYAPPPGAANASDEDADSEHLEEAVPSLRREAGLQRHDHEVAPAGGVADSRLAEPPRAQEVPGPIRQEARPPASLRDEAATARSTHGLTSAEALKSAAAVPLRAPAPPDAATLAAEIRALLEAGLIDEARARLVLLREAYPEYPLDATLRALAEE